MSDLVPVAAKKPTMGNVACIIPTHRRPNELKRAVRSVAAQTLKPTRIIVVNDAEPGPVEAALSAIQDAPPISVLHIGTSNLAGASRSRNMGLANANEQYLAFLDDDDEWCPLFLEEAVRSIESSALDIAFAWIEVVDGAGERLRVRRGKAPRTIGQVVTRNPGFTGSNIVMTRAALVDLDGFDVSLRVYNDLDLLVRALQARMRIDVIEEIMVRQTVSPGDHLSSRGGRRAQGILAYARKHATLLSVMDRRRIRRDYHLALRSPEQKWYVRQWHFVLMLCNSSLRQIWGAVADRVRGAGNAYG